MVADKSKTAFRCAFIIVLINISFLSSSQELQVMTYYGRDNFLLEGTEIADSLNEY